MQTETPVPLQQRAPDVIVLPPGRSLTLERWLTLVITLLPFLAFVLAIALFWNRGISPLDLSLFLGLYVISGLGVTIGFHRLLAHRSFKTKPWLRNVLASAGSLSVEGAVIDWVADHRRHHAFTDQPGDPHSPHLEEAGGVKGVLLGLWHAHMGWFFREEHTSANRFAPDLLKDPAMMKIHRLFPLWVVISLVLPALIGLAITQSVWGMLTAFLWGGLVRVFFLHHITWSINSICHFFGRRPFNSNDMSTNNWLLSVISFGEAWHNNHHAFPSSPIHGLEKWQPDPAGLLIRGMAKVGLAYDLKEPSPKEMQAKRSA
ncbi:MAG: fatty acid desaturase [Actinobacteria bacterium]|nr:fatty acid desaturase [Actinomycetota bacterium]